MNYGKLISRAFQITLRHRFLWLLGILAGASGGSFQYSSGGGEDEYGRVGSFDPVVAWASAHLFLVILISVVLSLIFVFFVVLSIIAKGGLIASVADIEEQRPVSFVAGMDAGFHAFWRVVGVDLLVCLAILFTIACAAVPIIALALTKHYVAAVLLGISLILPLIAVLIYLGLLIMYAERLAVVAAAGVIDSLRGAHRILFGFKGPVLLVGLIAIALGMGISLATFLVVLVIALPHIAAGIAVYLTLGLIPTLIYAALPALMLFATVLLLTGITNTFQSSYWTLAYLQLTQPPAERGLESKPPEQPGA
jgi:hypothetical protein